MADLEMAPPKERVALDCFVKSMESVDYHAQLMEDLVMAPHEERVTLDWFVKQMEPVQDPAQLMEGPGMEQRGALVINVKFAKQMEHALQVCLSEHIYALLSWITYKYYLKYAPANGKNFVWRL